VSDYQYLPHFEDQKRGKVKIWITDSDYPDQTCSFPSHSLLEVFGGKKVELYSFGDIYRIGSLAL